MKCTNINKEKETWVHKGQTFKYLAQTKNPEIIQDISLFKKDKLKNLEKTIISVIIINKYSTH